MATSMPSPVGDSGSSGSRGRGSAGSSLRLLVVLRAINLDRVTEGFLRCALERGHTVRVALEQRKAGRSEDAESLFDVLARDHPAFSFERLPAREELWLCAGDRLRARSTSSATTSPSSRDAEDLRERARTRAPWYVRLDAAFGIYRVGPRPPRP